MNNMATYCVFNGKRIIRSIIIPGSRVAHLALDDDWLSDRIDAEGMIPVPADHQTEHRVSLVCSGEKRSCWVGLTPLQEYLEMPGAKTKSPFRVLQSTTGKFARMASVNDLVSQVQTGYVDPQEFTSFCHVNASRQKIQEYLNRLETLILR